MTTGDDLRKIGTGRRPASSDPGGPSPILEPDRRRLQAVEDLSRLPPERHTLDQVNRLKAVTLSLWGGFLGFVLGMFASLRFPGAPLAALYPIVAGALGWAVVYLAVGVLTGGAGGLATRIYAPGGAGRRREYSLAESFAARGRYEDAISAFQLAAAEHPEDPVPYLRAARIYRDHLDDPEGAVRWFRRARDEAEMSEAQWRVVTRELIELYGRIGRRTRAAPELARLAELHPDTPEGEWARAELAEVKRLIEEERSGDADRSTPPAS